MEKKKKPIEPPPIIDDIPAEPIIEAAIEFNPPAPAIAGRAGKRRRGEVEKKVKTTIALTPDTARKLAIASAGLGVNPCDMVEALLKEALAGYREPSIPPALCARFAPGRALAS
jgi:hypothetical protein